MKQKLIFGTEGPISVYEWSKLDLGAMLHRRPVVSLLDESGQPTAISMVCMMPRLILADGASPIGLPETLFAQPEPQLRLDL